MEDEFESFMLISMKDQAQGHVLEGRWTAKEAEANISALREKFLPEGIKTSGRFFTLEDRENEQKVGSLWITLDEQNGEKVFS